MTPAMRKSLERLQRDLQDAGLNAQQSAAFVERIDTLIQVRIAEALGPLLDAVRYDWPPAALTLALQDAWSGKWPSTS